MSASLEHSFAILKNELDRGEDIYETPALVHEVSMAFGGDRFLCGDADLVSHFIEAVPATTTPSLVVEWLRIGTMYASDGGAGLRSLAKSWSNSAHPLKAFVSSHAQEIQWE
ncbi:MAG TPA: hypothetical protein VFW84_14120 [Aquabacterium sp.]|uniref:hypothetical protein n=1 Tax=Aquabacterium sp. TaxID=1872578 RepID=UPI002E31D8A6|nr:hypothetical protein [Aquabacterium sp.]HEX5373858.1 hypothetical protein [Aquabacterium sp.]